MSESADTQYEELHAQIAELKTVNGKLTQELASVKSDNSAVRSGYLAKINSLSTEKMLLHDKYVKVLERLVEVQSLVSEMCDCND